MLNQKMTAAQHFLLGETLLGRAGEETGPHPAIAQAIAARAQGHFAAAQLLLDLEKTREPYTALHRTGLEAVADERLNTAIPGLTTTN